MTERQTIESFCNKAKDDLIKNYDRIGLRASGKFEDDLESKITDLAPGWRITFLGSTHSQYMVAGRRKNINQNLNSLRAFVGWAGSTFLKEWVQNKGLAISPFAVAYKIAREGIKVPNPHNTGTLLSDVFTDERISDLLGDLMMVYVQDMRTDIVKITADANN